MIDPNKMTEKTQEAIVAAQQHARDNGDSQVDVEHLALALVQQQGGVVPSILTSLNVQPANTSVRTDLGTAYWYMGNADSAIAEFNQALTYAPNNANTLFNLGMVKWQGKGDSGKPCSSRTSPIGRSTGSPRRFTMRLSGRASGAAEYPRRVPAGTDSQAFRS